MISFLFFVKIAQNGELRSGDLFPHVFLFPERSEKPLVYRAAAGAPIHPVRSAERTWPPPHGERKATHHAEAGLPSEPPPSIISA